ncbi:hypothetical protein CEXT_794061 [Caerostris extrusa]|uniref:Uncharacterized protein n=1 Tax=Caerostris extrusa TaxID=172846 RepID=A0AAV4RF36_CAEEX|nr:hypothetical protein CEXT_794061 [Caerostris extrusa]
MIFQPKYLYLFWCRALSSKTMSNCRSSHQFVTLSEKDSEEHLAPIGDTTIDMEAEMQELPLQPVKSEDVDRMEEEIQELPLQHEKSKDVDRMEAEFQELPLQPENSEDVDRNTPSPEIVWCSASVPRMRKKKMSEAERRKRALNDIKELQAELLYYGDPEERDLGPFGCNTVDMKAKFREFQLQLEEVDEMDRLKRFLYSRLHESGWINRQQERIDVTAMELGSKMKYFELLNAVQDDGIEGISFTIKEDFFEECEKIQIPVESWQRIFTATAKQ